MHLELDDERQLLRETVRAFAADKIRPHARAWDEAGAVGADTLAAGWGLGLAGAGVPARYGGQNDSEEATPSALSAAIALEELAWADLAFAQRLLLPLHAVVPLVLYGDEAHKRAWLPRLAGESMPAATVAWIEPSRRFDLAGVRTRAEPAADGTALFGSKALVPQARDAEITMVYAREAAASGPYDVQAFVVQGKTVSGMRRGDREETLGVRGNACHRVELDDCTAHPVGGRRGVDYQHLAARALCASAAAAVGVGRAAAEYAAAYAKERRAFGRPIAQYQSIAFMIADAFTDVEAGRLMVWKAAWRIDRGEPALKEASLAFRLTCDAAFRIADCGVQILGGHGVIRDHLAELFFRNARTLAATPGWFMV